MDINDNAPTFAVNYETFVCENATPGQVRNNCFLFITDYTFTVYECHNLTQKIDLKNRFIVHNWKINETKHYQNQNRWKPEERGQVTDCHLFIYKPVSSGELNLPDCPVRVGTMIINIVNH